MKMILALMVMEAVVWIVAGLCIALGRPSSGTQPAPPACGAAVERARELRTEKLPTREIAFALNGELYRDSCGAEFSERSVERVLKAAPVWPPSLKYRRS